MTVGSQDYETVQDYLFSNIKSLNTFKLKTNLFKCCPKPQKDLKGEGKLENQARSFCQVLSFVWRTMFVVEKGVRGQSGLWMELLLADGVFCFHLPSFCF